MNKLELKEHLDKVRHTISEVDRILSSHSYGSDKRTVMVMGLLSTMVGNLRTMLQLIRSGGMSGAAGLWRERHTPGFMDKLACNGRANAAD